MRQSDWWPAEGEEPDPRWSLANERTLLAYSRTALALVVAGLAIAGSHRVADLPVWVAVLGLPAIALGAAVALVSDLDPLVLCRHRYSFDPTVDCLRFCTLLSAPRV